MTGADILSIPSMYVAPPVFLPIKSNQRLTPAQDLLLDGFYRIWMLCSSYRFYAGTPITTDRNINIGVLFVFVMSHVRKV